MSHSDVVNSANESNTITELERYALTRPFYLLLFVACIYTSSFLFGVFLSISAYLLMPYGHRIPYLGTILSPWMLSFVWCFVIFKPFVPKGYLLILIALGSVIFSADLIISFKSLCPPFVHTTEGNVLVLLIWFTTYILLGYPSLVIASYVGVRSSNGMLWFDVHVQLGSLIGSIIAYRFVEAFSLFREQLPCEEARR